MAEGPRGYTKKDLYPKSTRRKFVIGTAAAGALGLLARFRKELPVVSTLPPVLPNNPPPDNFLDPSSYTPEQIQSEREATIQRLNKIRDIELNSDARFTEEADYVKDANTLEKIDLGFMALGRRVNRGELLKKRFRLRQAGLSELPALSQELIDWANERKIHPEVIAVCRDAAVIALPLIDALKNVLRDDYHGKAEELANANPEQFMLSIGGMASLVAFETGRSLHDDEGRKMGFTFIGAGLAKPNYGGDDYRETGPEDLKKVCALLSKNSGIQYTEENMQGSVNPFPGDPDSSGGALGIQMMPDRVLEIYKLMEGVQVNGKPFPFNPFDLTSSVVGSWLFLAQHKFMGKNAEGKNMWRWGVDYSRELKKDIHGKEDKKADTRVRPAAEKWNGLEKEIDFIYDGDTHYRARFPQAA